VQAETRASKRTVLVLDDLIPPAFSGLRRDAPEFIPTTAVKEEEVVTVKEETETFSGAAILEKSSKTKQVSFEVATKPHTTKCEHIVIESIQIQSPWFTLPSVGSWLLPPPLSVGTPSESAASDPEALPTQADLIRAFCNQDYIGCAVLIRMNKALHSDWKAITPHLMWERDKEVHAAQEQLAERSGHLAAKESEWSELHARAAAASNCKGKRKEASTILRDIEKAIAEFQPEKLRIESEIRELRRAVHLAKLHRRLLNDLMLAILEGDMEAIQASSSHLHALKQKC